MNPIQLNVLQSLSFSVLAIALFVGNGCSKKGPEIASVEGTVTLDGQPLPHAAVIFNPENGRPAGASTDKNGYYILNFTKGRKGAIPGKNRVVITTVRDPGVAADEAPIPGSGEKLPMKYNAQTELSFVVEDGKRNIADFNLESSGEIADVSTAQ